MAVWTAEKRVQAAVALQPADRTPIGHSVDAFAASYGGITQEAWWFDHDRAHAALAKTCRELGPWDTLAAFAPGHPLAFALTAPMRVKLPGRDIPADVQMQFDELELMTRADYEFIVERGWAAFLDMFFPRLGIDPALATTARADIARHGQEDERAWLAMGVHPLAGGKLRLPFDWFAYARSLTGFITDLFECPQLVIDAMDATLPAMLDATRAGLGRSSARGVVMPMARGSVTFISPRYFEKFCFPWMRRAAEVLVQEGYVPIFHCDSNWTPLLRTFRQLPARQCILQLDEQTDIFKAKELLGDHMCLMGNVSSPLLSLAEPDEVYGHCRRLVERVGEGGGFILGPACTTPIDARPENVLAMTRAVLH